MEDLGGAAGEELLPVRQVENLGAPLWYVVLDRLADDGGWGSHELVAHLRFWVVLRRGVSRLRVDCLLICHTNEVGSERHYVVSIRCGSGCPTPERWRNRDRQNPLNISRKTSPSPTRKMYSMQK